MSRKEQSLSPAQVALLNRGKTSHAAYKKAVDDVELRVAAFREQIIGETEALRVRWVQDAHAAREGGVPVTRIARDILAHKGTAAAYQAVDDGARYVTPAAAQDAASTQFVRDAEFITFAPDAADVAAVAAKLGLSEDAVPTDTSATFTVEDGLITAVTPFILPSGQMHPVVAMVMADGSKHGRALVEFAEGVAA